MLRIKLPQGQADATQLRALAEVAEVAERYSRGYGHVTTRQNFQVHFLRPADLEPAMRRLAAAGITTHGAGGNAVRNAEIPVHLSGCPNGCSQHHVAAIGLQGSARKLGGRPLPQVFVLVGGGVDEPGASFGRLVGKVPARRAPEAVRRLVERYLAGRTDGERAHEFFNRAFDRAKEVVAPLEELRLEKARPEDFIEPGATEPFRPDSQDGECAA